MTPGITTTLIAALALSAVSVPSALAATPPEALVMGWNIDAISTFDPAQVAEVVTLELLMNACDRLMEYDTTDEAASVPGLAESMTLSEDGRSMVFRLREGLTFPSGREATAQDAAWSLQRVLKLGLGAAAGLTEYGFSKANAEETIRATDERTLVLTFDQAYPPSLITQAIATYPLAIVLDREELEANQVEGDLGNKYLATRTACVGPYHLARWTPGEMVLLQRNPDYWGDAPAFSQILVRHISEAATQRLMLEKGDIDVARDLTPEDITELSTKAGIGIAQVTRPNLTYITLNTLHPVLSDPRVRLALRYLLDYEALGETIVKHVGIIRQSPIQLGAFGALDEKEGAPFKLDLAKAKALLTEAGVPEGTRLNFYVSTAPHALPIGQHFQANAASVGLQINVERMATSQMFARVRGRDFDMAVIGWQTSVADGHGMASRQIYNPDNAAESRLTQYPTWRSGYFSADYNQRVNAALLERDPAQRAALYHALQRDQMQDGPQVFMYQAVQNVAYRDSLDGWKAHGFRPFYDLMRKK